VLEAQFFTVPEVVAVMVEETLVKQTQVLATAVLAVMPAMVVTEQMPLRLIPHLVQAVLVEVV
jgi:hypothetical protein